MKTQIDKLNIEIKILKNLLKYDKSIFEDPHKTQYVNFLLDKKLSTLINIQ